MATFGGGTSHGPSLRAGELSFFRPSQPRERGGHSHLLRARARARARAGPGVDKSHRRSQKPSLQVQLGAGHRGAGTRPRLSVACGHAPSHGGSDRVSPRQR